MQKNGGQRVMSSLSGSENNFYKSLNFYFIDFLSNVEGAVASKWVKMSHFFIGGKLFLGSS